MSKPLHQFHLVDPSPWPLTASFSAGFMAAGLVLSLYLKSVFVLMLALIGLLLSSAQWWRDVGREATMQGHHTSIVQNNMRWGMILFIVSEVMFFFSFFWAYFNMGLAPVLETGMVWPPTGIDTFNPFGIPLLNTCLLLVSGAAITWSHHCILSDCYEAAVNSLGLTMTLGIVFEGIQAFEYYHAPFTFSDSTYGSCFFIATGFHGLHVLVGLVFIGVSHFRLLMGSFSSEHHFGFEAAAWYWHFVDVVWVFLFISVYWWGGCT